MVGATIASRDPPCQPSPPCPPVPARPARRGRRVCTCCPLAAAAIVICMCRPSTIPPGRCPCSCYCTGIWARPRWFAGFLHLADEKGLMLLAPGSHASSWDIITQRAYGPDLDLADRALTHAFQHYAVDPSRIGIGGFPDGASYALTLGVANG